MINKAAQLKAFETIYEHLNAQQKLAVDTIDGPVMVIAGQVQARPRYWARALVKYF
jgi:hypothetical protein